MHDVSILLNYRELDCELRNYFTDNLPYRSKQCTYSQASRPRRLPKLKPEFCFISYGIGS